MKYCTGPEKVKGRVGRAQIKSFVSFQHKFSLKQHFHYDVKLPNSGHAKKNGST